MKLDPLSLPELLNARLPARSRAELTPVYRDLAPLFVERDDIASALSAASDEVQASDETDLVAQRALSGEPLVANVLPRERKGCRRYAWWVEDYSGQLLPASKKAAALQPEAVQLQNIANELRWAIRPEPGHLCIDLDVTACHLSIAAAVSGDPRLQADLQHDVHQVVGDLFVPEIKNARTRRELGKAVNNPILNGVSPEGLCDDLMKHGWQNVELEWVDWLMEAWWARYPGLGAWLDELDSGLADRALHGLPLTIEAPDGHTFRFSPAEVAGFKRGEWRGAKSGQRSIDSSLWRAVEGACLDHALVLMQGLRQSHGLRLALPMFDGMLMVAPEETAKVTKGRAEELLVQAFADAGVVVQVKGAVRARWGEQA